MGYVTIVTCVAGVDKVRGLGGRGKGRRTGERG